MSVGFMSYRYCDHGAPGTASGFCHRYAFHTDGVYDYCNDHKPKESRKLTAQERRFDEQEKDHE